MKRRTVLSGLAGGLGLGVAAPALSQSGRALRLVTDRPEEAALFSERLARTTGDGLTAEVSVVRAEDRPEIRRTVGEGNQDMYLSSDANFVREDPSLMLFSATPNGMSPNEMEAWIYTAGGADIWDTISPRANIKSFLAGDSGPTPLWTREPVSSPASIGGPIASVGAGLAVLEKLGIEAHDLATDTSDLSDAFGLEGLSTADIVARNLHQTFPYLYAPSASLPSSAVTLGVNTDVLASLSEAEADLLEKCITAHNGESRARTAYQNASAFRDIASEVTVSSESPELWEGQIAAAEDLLGDVESLGETEAAAVRAYLLFYRDVDGWSDIGEAAYFAGRKRVLSDAL